MGVELKFTCEDSPKDYLTVKSYEKESVTIWVVAEDINKFGKVNLNLDINTAIKLSKTLRTEINKAKEGGQNGN